MLAPIVLFTYNRPSHTRQTLEALSKNHLADESELFVFSDGPEKNASAEEIDKMTRVRKIVKEKSWCKSVQLIELTDNIGLAKSIIQGVTRIVNQFGKVIVLEDDIITSVGFLKYMNDALDMYNDDEKVMHISGYMFPVKRKLSPTFFYNTTSCWGWGTWKRAWKFFDDDVRKLRSVIYQNNQVDRFNIENSYPFLSQLEDNMTGKINTWAIKWYASVFINGGFALHPYPSLTNNIGHDNSGTHCSVNRNFYWEKLASEISVKRIPIVESMRARKAMNDFNYLLFNKKRSYSSKLWSKTKSIIKQILLKLRNLKNYSANRELGLNNEINIEKHRVAKIPRYMDGFFNGPEFKISFVDSASFLFMYNEIFEKEIYKFHTDNKSPYIIDCGANIGLSIIYFKNLYPDSEIIAFEPDQHVFEILQKNISSLKLNNVRLINKALWCEDTKIKFFSEGADGGRIAIDSDNSDIKITETTRLKYFLENRQVDFLKLDIEGAETNVIIDCGNLISNVKYLFVEYHSFINQSQTLHKILNVLSENNFRYYIYHIGVTSANPYMGRSTHLAMDNQLNIFAVRS